MLILASILFIKAMALVCIFKFMPLAEKDKTFLVSQCDIVVKGSALSLPRQFIFMKRTVTCHTLV